MEELRFPVEFNNELDDVKKSDNEFYQLAVERLNKLAESHDDISGAVVNFKKPAQGRETAYINEITIIVYMLKSSDFAATQKGENFRATLDGALDAIERQVREHRKRQRNH